MICKFLPEIYNASHAASGGIIRSSARQVAKTLYDGAMSLEAMPHRGRGGRIAGTRELVFAPYVIVYRVEAESVEILRIYHNAQDWP